MLCKRLQKNHGVDLFAIRGRATAGKFAGGADGFKIEGIIQLAADKDVMIISPQTVAASIKKSGLADHPDLPNNQQKAFQVAHCALDTLR
jgi:DUF3010 family protein